MRRLRKLLRGLPAAGSLCSPLPLALASHPHTLSTTIKISKIALFRFLASEGGLGGHHRHRLNLPRYDEQVSNATFSKNGLEQPRKASNNLGGQTEAVGSNDPRWDLEM